MFYNWEEGVKIRKNLELLECWAVDSGIELANNYLRKVISVADFLATSKQFLLQVEIDSFTFTSINIDDIVVNGYLSS